MMMDYMMKLIVVMTKEMRIEMMYWFEPIE